MNDFGRLASFVIWKNALGFPHIILIDPRRSITWPQHSIRSEAENRPSDFEESVALHRQALELRPALHPDRLISLNDLGNALDLQFQKKGQPSDLVESIS
jgi:hypothetical protein